VTSRASDPSASEFYQALRKVVDKERDALVECWDVRPQYTPLMLEQILPEVVRELDMSYDRECHDLDAILYRETDEVYFNAKDEWAKYISVALEHENDHSTAAEEMIKLQRFNVPLTVLITYPEESAKNRMLDKYSEIIQQADVLGNSSTNLRQLAIFGYKGARWEAFAYKNRTFAPVQRQSLAASA
jgi:hypothetical protein